MVEESFIKYKKKTLILIIFTGFLALFASSILSLFSGVIDLKIEDLPCILTRLNFLCSNMYGVDVIWSTRIPRIITAIVIGSSLATAGVVMQGIFKNPLVDPFIGGISSGAVFAVSTSILLGITITSHSSIFAYPVTAFLGALFSLILTLLFTRLSGGSSLSFLLSGLAIGFLFSSATTIVITLTAGRSFGIIFWLFGSLITASWRFLSILIPVSIVVMVYVLLNARNLNVLILGDEEASQLGLNVKLVKYSLITSLALLTSTTVAFNGVIGFVGLLAPHISRLIVGEDHRLLIPSSMFTGATILVLADIIARIAIAPAELPIGAITSAIGAPFFLALHIKNYRRFQRTL
ncbi:MAG: iron ABC transporter permease [Nitrososphaerota archaeon]|nr:iron ABC transporter permease [Candidatus Geocrenenecus dongiae]